MVIDSKFKISYIESVCTYIHECIYECINEMMKHKENVIIEHRVPNFWIKNLGIIELISIYFSLYIIYIYISYYIYIIFL